MKVLLYPSDFTHINTHTHTAYFLNEICFSFPKYKQENEKKKSPPFLGDIESKCGEGTGGLSFYPGSKSEAQLFDSRCAVFIKLNSTLALTSKETQKITLFNSIFKNWDTQIFLIFKNLKWYSWWVSLILECKIELKSIMRSDILKIMIS